MNWLIIYGFMSCSRIFHLYGDVTIAGEVLQNLGLCSEHRAFEQVTRDLGFSGLILKKKWNTVAVKKNKKTIYFSLYQNRISNINMYIIQQRNFLMFVNKWIIGNDENN
jgi:hypothetical protein